MSFKHTKFDDSAVLRSLEKIAVDKKLIQLPVMTKSASQLVADKDLSPTGDFSHDIVKLCNELRKEGLHKHADEIESNYVAYKQAQTLYEAFKETGEDIVHAAHPDGPFVFEDVVGKPKVLDILTRQMEIIKKVNKEPTGKLAYNRNYQNLKLAFSSDTSLNDHGSVTDARKQRLREEAKKKITEAKNIYKQLCDYTDPILNINIERPEDLAFEDAISTPTVANVIKLQSQVKDVESSITPSEWLGGAVTIGVYKNKWDHAKSLLNDIYDLIGDDQKNSNLSEFKDTAYALLYRSERLKKSMRRRRPEDGGSTNEIPSTEFPGVSGQSPEVEDEFRKIDTELDKMDAYKRTAKVSESTKASIIADKIINKFEEIKKRYTGVKDFSSILSILQNEVATGQRTVKKFYEKYVA